MSNALLSHEETIALLRRAKAGDEAAQEALVIHNTGLVKSLASRFLNRNVEYEELFQIGSIGLIKAIRNYDESYNVRFSTYAVPLIMGEIKRFLRDDGILKVSRMIKESSRKVLAAAEQLRGELGREATILELCETLDMTPEEIVYAMEAAQQPVSLDEPIYEEGGNAALLMDRIPSKEQPDIEERIMLKEMIGNLEPRERQIILMRYFKDMTQSEIARRLGVSQVQISRLESKILDKLRSKAL
ncbi:MAG: SigB/SigF/SigG family RNA polymerase sigma factor [Christensenellales bacterium]|jgi:RNA polymerase sporulation-specific sigma factor